MTPAVACPPDTASKVRAPPAQQHTHATTNPARAQSSLFLVQRLPNIHRGATCCRDQATPWVLTSEQVKDPQPPTSPCNSASGDLLGFWTTHDSNADRSQPAPRQPVRLCNRRRGLAAAAANPVRLKPLLLFDNAGERASTIYSVSALAVRRFVVSLCLSSVVVLALAFFGVAGQAQSHRRRPWPSAAPSPHAAICCTHPLRDVCLDQTMRQSR